MTHTIKNMKNRYWFTLTELIIGVSISAIILLVILSFVADLLSDFGRSQKKTEFISGLYDFIETVNQYRQIHDDIYIIDNGNDDFDALMLYSSGSTGVLFAVIDKQQTQLDPRWNNAIYSEKLLGYKELTTGQVTDVLSDNTEAYDYGFF